MLCTTSITKQSNVAPPRNDASAVAYQLTRNPFKELNNVGLGLFQRFLMLASFLWELFQKGVHLIVTLDKLFVLFLCLASSSDNAHTAQDKQGYKSAGMSSRRGISAPDAIWGHGLLLLGACRCQRNSTRAPKMHSQRAFKGTRTLFSSFSFPSPSLSSKSATSD